MVETQQKIDFTNNLIKTHLIMSPVDKKTKQVSSGWEDPKVLTDRVKFGRKNRPDGRGVEGARSVPTHTLGVSGFGR